MSNGPVAGPYTPDQAQVLGIPATWTAHDCDTRHPCPHPAGPPTAVTAGATGLPAETVARLFHEAYERLAPSFGYETRKASAVPWDQVPDNNRRLMTAVAAEVAPAIAAHTLRDAVDQLVPLAEQHEANGDPFEAELAAGIRDAIQKLLDLANQALAGGLGSGKPTRTDPDCGCPVTTEQARVTRHTKQCTTARAAERMAATIDDEAEHYPGEAPCCANEGGRS